jgi:threonine aldolase
MYVPTGTMANLCAHMAHTAPGQELICGALAHTYTAEAGGASRIAGLSIRTVPHVTAEMDPAAVEAAIRQPDVHYPPAGLIWFEQPSRGYVAPLENLAAVSAVAKRHGLPLHIDGARVFNAATYLGVEAKEIAQYGDSIMFCVSKGLAAPVGSILTGSADFIERARTARKILGGSMRQAGVIAAGGIFALENSRSRLAEDHENAHALAAGFRTIPALKVDRAEIQTNIFFVDVLSDTLPAAAFSEAMKVNGVLVNAPRRNSKTIRFVANAGVSRSDIDETVAIARRLLS